MFFNTTVTVLRNLAGHYDNDGYFVQGKSSTLTIKANVQPLNQREMAQYTAILPGGNRTAQLMKMYTNAFLNLDSQISNITADVIVWNNREFKVVMLEEWQSNIISHYRYILQEIITNDNC